MDISITWRRRTPSNGILNSAFYIILFLIFIIMPYIAVLRYGFPVLIIGDTSITALSKDLLTLAFIFLGAISVLSKLHHLRFDKFELSLIILIVYSMLRAIATSATLANSAGSFRHEVLFIILSLVLYRLCRTNFISHETIDKIFSRALLINLLAVITIGYLEIANKDILAVLYGEKANSLVLGIPGIPEVRTVSTLENPINLALFLTLAVLYFAKSAPGTRYSSLFFCLLALPLVVSTLSRFFILIYFLVFLNISAAHFMNIALRKKFIILATITASLAFLFLNTDIDYLNYVSIDIFEKRLEQTFSLFEEMDDPRFINWGLAINEMRSIPVLGELMGLGLGVSNPGDFSPGQFRIENTFLTVLLQLGLIGFCIFFFPFAIVTNSYRLLRKPTFVYGRKYLYIVGAILVGGLSNDTHRNMPFSLYLWVSLAMAAIYVRRHTYKEGDVKVQTC